MVTGFQNQNIRPGCSSFNPSYHSNSGSTDYNIDLLIPGSRQAATATAVVATSQS
jgi:hypothetical protein